MPCRQASSASPLRPDRSFVFTSALHADLHIATASTFSRCRSNHAFTPSPHPRLHATAAPTHPPPRPASGFMVDLRRCQNRPALSLVEVCCTPGS